MYNARRIIAILFIILFLFSCKKTPTGSDPDGITFPDANFETLIRETLNKLTGDITPADMLTITYLDGAERDISDISGIEYCTDLWDFNLANNLIVDISALNALTKLQWVILPNNQIIDISALSTLTNIRGLNLTTNQIIDIEPLIQNSGIDNGDNVYLNNNPLSDTSINTYIPQLEARGVTVHH